MRNAYGSQYFSQTELAARKVSFEDIGKFDPMLSNNLSIGADLRTLYYYSDKQDQSTFFQMEGNLYLTAQLEKWFSVSLSKGLYSGFEAYGLAYLLPKEGYIKAGRFQPAYGWYFDDHTAFVREKMLWPPNSYDTGIEIGILPQNVSASLGLFNGSSGSFDENKSKAVATRMEIRRNIAGIGFGLGGSYYYNRKSSSKISMYGPFYYLKTGSVILTAEVGLRSGRRGQSDSLALAISNELAWVPKQGYWIKGQYDFYDEDIDKKTGATARYGLGLHYYPIGFMEIAPIFRYYDEIDRQGNHNGYFSFDGQMHFFF